MWTERVRVRTVLAAVGCLLVVGCGETGGEAVVAERDAADAAAAAPAAETPAAPATVADLFPPGEGREIVLNNCASCHEVACAAIGQRPENRWRELADAHAEHVPSLTTEQRELAFSYLAANFSDGQPEPNVPPEFLTRGCTPF